FRGRALVEGAEPQGCLLANAHLIDIIDGDTELYGEVSVFGHDGDQSLGGRNNTADGGDVEFVDGAGGGREDFRACISRFGCRETFLGLGYLCLDETQFAL